MNIKKVDALNPVTTREITRLNKDIHANTLENEAKGKQIETIRAVEEAQISNLHAEKVKDIQEKDWRIVHNPSEAENFPLVRRIDPEIIATNMSAAKVENTKDWRIVSEPNEDQLHPLIKDTPAQTALKKLNII